MKNATITNELAVLNTQLLSNLDETVFFSQLSGYFQQVTGEHKVQVYEAMGDGSTRLGAENGHSIDGEILAKGIGLSGYVARMKRAYYSNNVKRDPITAHSKRDDSVEAELAVPVMHEGVVIGTIHIQSTKKDRSFSEKDVAAINEDLKSLAAPIRNMRLYLVARHMARELESKLAQREVERTQAPRFDIKTGTQNIEERVNLIAVSKSMLETIQVAKKLAAQDFPILLDGAHGSGKKILARKIHFWSHRKNGACVLVHCTSMQEAALDIELFGKKGKKGAFAEANGGTLILDDIEALSHTLQAKILRAMVTGEVVSSDNEEKTMINVRVIATCKSSLEEAVKKGEFKEELYIRLNSMNIKVAPLRQRQDDIRALAEFFLNQNRSQNEAKILTAAAQAKLAAYHWPGNVQELKGIIERVSVVVEGQYVDESHLPELRREEVKEEVKVEVKFEEVPLHDLEKTHILATLDHLSGNKTRAAKSLGITVKTLYNKLHSYGLIENREA
ncbi:MAG: sigma 54-interacting transcriptional regulator [Bacteriovoracaceae bacterium]|nr:sigma 54-interacting transcriptional regulator [Bacteriovoracaceae bacterium]